MRLTELPTITFRDLIMKTYTPYGGSYFYIYRYNEFCMYFYCFSAATYGFSFVGDTYSVDASTQAWCRSNIVLPPGMARDGPFCTHDTALIIVTNADKALQSKERDYVSVSNMANTVFSFTCEDP